MLRLLNKRTTIKLLFYILTISILFSCARINQQSKDYYNRQHLRHGVIPLSSSIVKKLDEASLARGRIIYQKNCLSCHGETGKGDGPAAQDQKHAPANLQKLAQDVRDFKFFMSISQWQGDMPGWKEPFNDIEREDLVNYIKSFR